MTNADTLPRFVVIQYAFWNLREILLKKLSDRRSILPLAKDCQEGEIGTWQEIPIACYSGPALEPTLVSILEQKNVEYVFSLGVAGTLSKNLQRGDLVAPTAAVRGDGATDFWANPRMPAVADAHALVALSESALRLGIPLANGVLYTTTSLYVDAAFVREWAALGVIGIDRTCAQQFLLAHMHRKKAAALYVVGDSLRGGGERLGEEILLGGIVPISFQRAADIKQVPIDGAVLPLDASFFACYERAVDIVLGAIKSLARS